MAARPIGSLPRCPTQRCSPCLQPHTRKMRTYTHGVDQDSLIRPTPRMTSPRPCAGPCSPRLRRRRSSTSECCQRPLIRNTSTDSWTKTVSIHSAGCEPTASAVVRPLVGTCHGAQYPAQRVPQQQGPLAGTSVQRRRPSTGTTRPVAIPSAGSPGSGSRSIRLE